MLEQYKDRIESICNHWAQAEVDIKLAENVCKSIVFPSIKELRYGGRRLAEVLKIFSTGGPEEKIQALIHDAEFDCIRARHDAIDAATSKMAMDMDIAVSKLGYQAVLTTFTKYAELVSRVDVVRRQIAESRGGTREQVYTTLEQSEFGLLVSLYSEFKTAEPLMKKFAVQESDKVKSSTRMALIGIVIGILGTIMGIILSD